MKYFRAAAMTAALAFAVSCAGGNVRSGEGVEVGTGAGAVWGVAQDDGLKVFKGIPYAKPPKGDLRYAPPQEPAPWKGTFHATAFGPCCPQLPDPGEAASGLRQDEDCLSLNIWTPGTDNRKRPVIVYLYGGAFNYGGAADPLYDGSAFAKRGDVVFTTVNYPDTSA